MRQDLLLLSLAAILATLAAPPAQAHSCTDVEPGDCGECAAFQNHVHRDPDGSVRCVSCVVDGIVCPYDLVAPVLDHPTVATLLAIVWDALGGLP